MVRIKRFTQHQRKLTKKLDPSCSTHILSQRQLELMGEFQWVQNSFFDWKVYPAATVGVKPVRLLFSCAYVTLWLVSNEHLLESIIYICLYKRQLRFQREHERWSSAVLRSQSGRTRRGHRHAYHLAQTDFWEEATCGCHRFQLLYSWLLKPATLTSTTPTFYSMRPCALSEERQLPLEKKNKHVE